jgi:hypothetical protein
MKIKQSLWNYLLFQDYLWSKIKMFNNLITLRCNYVNNGSRSILNETSLKKENDGTPTLFHLLICKEHTHTKVIFCFVLDNKEIIILSTTFGSLWFGSWPCYTQNIIYHSIKHNCLSCFPVWLVCYGYTPRVIINCEIILK